MELKNKVVLSEDDVKMVEDFFIRYNDTIKNNLPLPDTLKKEISIFKEKVKNDSYSVEDQRRFTAALCYALNQNSLPILKDDMIAEVMESCNHVWSDIQFYEELEKVIQDRQEDD